MRFRKRPTEIEAVRYGAEADGAWYDGALNDLEAWMSKFEEARPLTQPRGPWDPPALAALYIRHLHTDDTHWSDGWLPLWLGDWVVRGDGEFYPISDDQLRKQYEALEQ